MKTKGSTALAVLVTWRWICTSPDMSGSERASCWLALLSSLMRREMKMIWLLIISMLLGSSNS